MTQPDVVGEKSHVASTLIDRNIDLARDLGPARGLPAHHVSELLWSHGFGFGALIGEKRDELGRCQDLVDLRVQRMNDIRRHPGRADDAPPRFRIGARCPAFRERGHVGQQRCSPAARHRKRLDLAASDELERLRNAGYVHVDMAAGEIVECRCAALVGNMREFHACGQRDQFGRNLVDAAKTGRGVGDLARLAFGQGKQLAGGLHRQLV